MRRRDGFVGRSSLDGRDAVRPTDPTRPHSVEIVRTMSKAGMRRPERIPSVYRGNPKLLSAPAGYYKNASEYLEKEYGLGYLSTVYETSGLPNESYRAMIGATPSSSAIAPSLPEKSPRRGNRPKIQLTIPKQPLKNAELVAYRGPISSVAAFEQPWKSGEQLTVDTGSGPGALQSGIVDVQSSDSKGLSTQSNGTEDPGHVDEFSNELAGRVTRASSLDSLSDATSQYSASSISSYTTMSATSPKSVSSPMDQILSLYSVGDPAAEGVFDPVLTKKQLAMLESPRFPGEWSKNKPLPPEPLKGVAPLLITKKNGTTPVDVRSAGPKSSPLVSNFNMLDLQSIDRDFELTRPNVYKTNTAETSKLDQIAKDLEAQLTMLPLTARSAAHPNHLSLVNRFGADEAEFKEEEYPIGLQVTPEPSSLRRTVVTIPNRRVSCGSHADLCVFCDLKAALEKRGYRYEDPAPAVTSGDADKILLHIMQSLDSLSDLFSTAVLNRGFYTTFKNHEMSLMRHVLFKECPPAWELREASVPGADDQYIEGPLLEYTPPVFLKDHKRDMRVIAALKGLILTRCQTFLRLETVAGLAGITVQRVRDVDEALMRIFTFCRIFGSNNGREHDIVAQMDWLNGGSIARDPSTDRPQSIRSTEDKDLYESHNDTFNPPRSFGLGNEKDGLSAAQIYDIIELWNCLSFLVQQLIPNVAEARANGIFKSVEVVDRSKESETLEEWTYYILSLGPSAIWALSSLVEQIPHLAFAEAKSRGWTTWSLPDSGSSRSTFFKEALTRVYDERLAAITAASPVASSGHQSAYPINLENGGIQTVRERRAALAAELRLQKATASEGTVTPYPSPAKLDPGAYSFSAERPMSSFPRIMTELKPLPRPPPLPEKYAARPNLEKLRDDTAKIAQSFGFSPQHQRSASDPQTYANTRNLGESSSRIIDPVDIALYTLTHDLGFSREEATWALRKCETGERVEVTKAMDLLLRQRELGHRTSKSLDTLMGLGVKSPVTPIKSPVSTMRGGFDRFKKAGGASIDTGKGVSEPSASSPVATTDHSMVSPVSPTGSTKSETVSLFGGAWDEKGSHTCPIERMEHLLCEASHMLLRKQGSLRLPLVFKRLKPDLHTITAGSSSPGSIPTRDLPSSSVNIAEFPSHQKIYPAVPPKAASLLFNTVRAPSSASAVGLGAGTATNAVFSSYPGSIATNTMNSSNVSSPSTIHSSFSLTSASRPTPLPPLNLDKPQPQPPGVSSPGARNARPIELESPIPEPFAGMPWARDNVVPQRQQSAYRRT